MMSDELISFNIQAFNIDFVELAFQYYKNE